MTVITSLPSGGLERIDLGAQVDSADRYSTRTLSYLHREIDQATKCDLVIQSRLATTVFQTKKTITTTCTNAQEQTHKQEKQKEAIKLKKKKKNVTVCVYKYIHSECENEER